MSVHILANNALREHHASAHGGVSASDLSDICLIFLNDSIELLEIFLSYSGEHFRMCWTSV